MGRDKDSTQRPKKNISLWQALVTVLALLALAYFVFLATPRRPVLAFRIRCAGNLFTLRKALNNYATEFDNQYPTPSKWCDLLVQHVDTPETVFVCRGALAAGHEARCHYAMNPNAEPNSPADLVLLFESRAGWNQYGDPELLPPEPYHRQGINVLFNNGDVKFIGASQLAELKWKVEEPNSTPQAEAPRNSRRPANDAELQYWLKNMVWIHGFSNEEIAAATGLTEPEIIAALKRFDIRPDNRLDLYRGLPLYPWPYPGGRHPRIGFLEGAIDPQRETKFSVVTPWDRDSYVVVDIPEAIWSDLGLTYLAHTHIDTIWTARGIELEKLEWNRHPDGPLDIRRTLPNGIQFAVNVTPSKEAVHMEMSLTNGADQKLSDLRVQICVMTKMAKGFQQQTNDNKVFTDPYVACRSDDGARWIITAWESCDRPWANPDCPCFHSDPKFPDLDPGRTARLRGWLSFYEGSDIQAEFERIEQTGWRKPPQ